MTTNKHVLSWLDETVALCKPDKVVWIDGSDAQLQALRDEACSTGEMHKLNEEKLPGCYLHRTDPSDVARVEQRTFICSKKEEDAGPTNNWMAPEEAYAKLRPLFDGAMKGRTMYVIPYCMGPIGSPFSKVGVEVTDSIYVVLNMDIMTRMGKQALDQLGDSKRLCPRPAQQGHAGSGRQVHLPLPGGQHHLVRQLRLRRQRAAGQEVLRAENCFLPGQERGLDGRAHAHPRHRDPGRRCEVHHRCIPLRLRQDQPCHAGSPGDLQEAGLQGLVCRRRHRLAA